MTLKIFPIHIYRRYTVNNKKKTHPPPVFQPFVFPIYDISLEPLELQKIDIHLFISLSEELSAEKGIFQITKSADICKNAYFLEKNVKNTTSAQGFATKSCATDVLQPEHLSWTYSIRQNPLFVIHCSRQQTIVIRRYYL